MEKHEILAIDKFKLNILELVKQQKNFSLTLFSGFVNDDPMMGYGSLANIEVIDTECLVDIISNFEDIWIIGVAYPSDDINLFNIYIETKTHDSLSVYFKDEPFIEVSSVINEVKGSLSIKNVLSEKAVIFTEISLN